MSASHAAHSDDPDALKIESGPPHPYHLVEPSPWPLLGALAAGAMMFGAARWMHGASPLVFAIGLAGVLAVMAAWWRDIVRESVKEKAHTRITKIGLRYGMMLFIASEVMFFFAFFWAFFNAALFPYDIADGAFVPFMEGVSQEGVWPPPGIEPIPAFGLPLTMTVILLLSGTTVTFAHHHILEGRNGEAAKMLGVTVGLGVLFTGFQAYEYAHATFGMADGVYPSAFYLATGFHGFHVIIGTIFLAVMWLRTAKGHFTPDSHFGFEAAAWYWHFVDVVWLFLFVSIYWWGSGGAAGH